MRYPSNKILTSAWDALASHEVKSIGHYNSSMKMFPVGEGDFSFSHSLARHFGHGFNITATSNDKTAADLTQRYKYAKTNVRGLLEHGAMVSLGVNCVRMASHPKFQGQLYDRLIYNLPHAGFLLPEDHDLMILKHQELCFSFFESSSKMMTPEGEIHVVHKNGGPYERWNLENLAKCYNLKMIERIPFKKETYPGYHQKRGDGRWADFAFDLGECSTYKFAKSPVE